MPTVSPFEGLLFDPDRSGPLDQVTAPPYDVITAEQERAFHEASPHNVVRLILGRHRAGSEGHADQYTRAAEHLRRWRDDGILAATEGPAWFAYEMGFAFQGHDRRVRGLIAAVDVEPWGGSIVPHERTMPGPVEDRLRLLRSVRANLSAVYAVAGGPVPALGEFLSAAAERPPDREVVDEEGVSHRLWVVPPGAPGAGDEITGALAAEQLLIADGHHRYTTALAYREEMRAEHGPGPWDRMMMLVVDGGSEDPPVLPIHRVVRGGRMPEPLPPGHRVRDLAEVLATLHDDDLLVGTAERNDRGELVHRVCRLDGTPPTVCALHEQVLGDAELRFTPDAVAAEEAVRRDRAPAAFFLPPTHVARIQSVIASGARLPEKSTYFWPKPRTGMVIRPLEPHPELAGAGR